MPPEQGWFLEDLPKGGHYDQLYLYSDHGDQIVNSLTNQGFYQKYSKRNWTKYDLLS